MISKGTSRANSARSPDESDYRQLKNELLRKQVEEIQSNIGLNKSNIELNKSTIEKNQAVTKAANLKSEFWGIALRGLNSNSLLLELRSPSQGHQLTFEEES